MKIFTRNYSTYKKLLSQASSMLPPNDYPIFCMTLGYLSTQIHDFDLLYTTLQTAFQLIANERLLETNYFQWLIFLNDHPHRFLQCIDFIHNIQRDQTLDVFDQIQSLISSNFYTKKPLKAQQRYNSVDTVVMDFNPERPSSLQQEKVQRIHYRQQKQKVQRKNSYSSQSDELNLIRKMQQDDQLAGKLQQENEQQMQDYKSKMKVDQTLCEICYVDLYEGDPCFLENCKHGFHRECIAEGFKINISTNTFPLRCPNAECTEECLESEIKFILGDTLYTKYQDHTLKAYAEQNGESVSWCPTAACGWMFFFEKCYQPRFQCPECKKEYCLNCRCDWHKDMSCTEYKISNTMSEDDKKFLDFAEGHKFKQCPKCKFWVEKTDGCDHMRCKCKFEFCYKCGGVYMKCECMAKARQNHERMLAARAMPHNRNVRQHQRWLASRCQSKLQSQRKKLEKAKKKESKEQEETKTEKERQKSEKKREKSK